MANKELAGNYAREMTKLAICDSEAKLRTTASNVYASFYPRFKKTVGSSDRKIIFGWAKFLENQLDEIVGFEFNESFKRAFKEMAKDSIADAKRVLLKNKSAKHDEIRKGSKLYTYLDQQEKDWEAGRMERLNKLLSK